MIQKEKAIAAAKKFLEKGQIDKAILEYKKIVEADPSDMKSLQKLGELLARQGSRQEAINTFTKLADLLIKNGFANRAISIYKQILQLNPLLIPAYIKLSEIFKNLGLSKDARIFNQRAIEIVQKASPPEDVYKLINKIIEIDPDDVVSRIALAETCLKLKKTDEAISHFEAALPILRAQRLDDIFIRAAERLLFHKPDNVELCRELAIIFMNRKEIPKAMKLLLHCRKLDPEDLETLDLLIAHFVATQNKEKAILVLFEKYKLLNKKGRENEALQVLKQLIEIDPDNAEAQKLLKEKQSVIRQDYLFKEPVDRKKQQAIPKPPSLPTAPVEAAVQEEIENKYLLETDIFLKYGLREKAFEHLFRAIEETNGSIKIREKLKDLYIDSGDLNQGIYQLFLLAQQTRDTDPEASLMYLKEILLLNPAEERASKMIQQIQKKGDFIPAQSVTLEKVVPLENVVHYPYEKGEEPIQELSSFLDEETSDILHKTDEPFGSSSVPPVTPHLPEISDEEISTLELETSDEPLTDEIQSEAPSEAFHLPDTASALTQNNKSAIGIPRGFRKPMIEQVLDEADFFVSQGLTTDAIQLLEDLKSYYPDNPLISEKIAEIQNKQFQQPFSTTPDDAIDELSNLEKIFLKEENHTLLSETFTPTPDKIDGADAQSHHDLGIAYMEMGLYNQAISEFKISTQNPEMEATAYCLIGKCMKLEGRLNEAIEQFKSGLNAKVKTLEQEIELYNELAEVYIQTGDYTEAYFYLQNIKKKKPDYKDIDLKIDNVKRSFQKQEITKEKAERKKTDHISQMDTTKEIDEAFDDLFGNFTPKK